MKPIKDLAEFLENNPRVNQRALTRFNYNLEAIRITVAQARDQLNVMTTKLTPHEYRSISTLVFNLERFLEHMDQEQVVPSTPEPDFDLPIEQRARRFFVSKGWTSLQFQDDLLPVYEQGFKEGKREALREFKIATDPQWRAAKLKEVAKLQEEINRSMLQEFPIIPMDHAIDMGEPMGGRVEYKKPSEFPLSGDDRVDVLRYMLGNANIGSDGSGDCQECKEAFDPNKWINKESLSS